MPTSDLNILLVEDNPGDARLLREGLREIDGLRFELSHMDTLTRALERLRHHEFAVGVLDLGLPDAQGLEVVRAIHNAAPDMPLLVLTALNDEHLAIQSLREGAQDYLVKAELDSASLWRSLRYAMERHRVQMGLLNLSLVDDLTGLSNRKGFLSLANHHAKLASRTRKTFLVGFIDLDGLKHINDTFGHEEGNHALLEAANVLRDSFRQSDILGRCGGDEFAVVVADAAEDSAGIVTDRVQEKVRVRNAQPGVRYPLSLSMGIVACDPLCPPDLGQLLHRADALMYHQKRDRQLRSCDAQSADPLLQPGECDHPELPDSLPVSDGSAGAGLHIVRRRDFVAQMYPAAKPAHILIADDETAVRDLVDQVLRSAGYSTARAIDGQDALEMAKQLGPFDLLLTDEMMPRMLGHELAQQLRQREPSLKVLYFTGYSGRLFAEKAGLKESESFLDKPSTPDGLLEAVSQLLGGSVSPANALA
jgi:diguanylate cyclase (GGDEF)-like protein